MSSDRTELREAAIDAASYAYAPYSGLHVGAAARTDDGRIVAGCNVENASFGLTTCAEVGLVHDLHRTGGGRLVALECTSGDGAPLLPCGRCRQVLLEAAGPDLIINDEHTLGELLPHAFTGEDLPAGPDS